MHIEDAPFLDEDFLKYHDPYFMYPPKEHVVYYDEPQHYLRTNSPYPNHSGQYYMVYPKRRSFEIPSVHVQCPRPHSPRKRNRLESDRCTNTDPIPGYFYGQSGGFCHYCGRFGDVLPEKDLSGKVTNGDVEELLAMKSKRPKKNKSRNTKKQSSKRIQINRNLEKDEVDSFVTVNSNVTTTKVVEQKSVCDKGVCTGYEDMQIVAVKPNVFQGKGFKTKILRVIIWVYAAMHKFNWFHYYL